MGNHLITTPARPEECHRCGVWTLGAWVDGGRVNVDPTPVDEQGEFAALLERRRTFDAIVGRVIIWLSWRSAHDIGQPRRYPVLAEHRRGCPHRTFIPRPYVPHPAAAELPDVPPF